MDEAFPPRGRQGFWNGGGHGVTMGRIRCEPGGVTIPLPCLADPRRSSSTPLVRSAAGRIRPLERWSISFGEIFGLWWWGRELGEVFGGSCVSLKLQSGPAIRAQLSWPSRLKSIHRIDLPGGTARSHPLATEGGGTAHGDCGRPLHRLTAVPLPRKRERSPTDGFETSAPASPSPLWGGTGVAGGWGPGACAYCLSPPAHHAARGPSPLPWPSPAQIDPLDRSAGCAVASKPHKGEGEPTDGAALSGSAESGLGRCPSGNCLNLGGRL